MLGTLAKYIFGGLMSDAPESTESEMQYHTREVNDWLLVDMPDQAIDDEDMNSESDEDEILTALPLLMAEEVTLQIVQSCEELKDHSACDNSSGKVQKHLDVKIRSVPSGVQHNSSDKNQGNFVDKVEDNIPTKVQDISASTQDFPNSIIQDKYDIQVRDISVQTNSSDKIQISNYTMPKYFDNKNKCVSSQMQCNLDAEIESNSTAKVEVLITGENSTNKMQAKSLENFNDEVSEKSSDTISQSSSDEDGHEIKPSPQYTFNKEEILKQLRREERRLQIKAHEALGLKPPTLEPQPVFENNVEAEVHKDYVDKIINYNNSLVGNNSDPFAPKVLNLKITKKFHDKETATEIENCLINNIQENKLENQNNTNTAKFPFVSGQKILHENIEEPQENCERDTKFLIRGQNKFYQQCNNENQLNKIQDNFNCGRRLYSQVVKGCNDSVQVNFHDSDDQIISSFDNKVDTVFVGVENNFLANIQNIITEDQSNNIQVILPGTEMHKMYDQYVSKTAVNENNTFQEILNNELSKLYQQYIKPDVLHSNQQIQNNLGFGRKLYSQVLCENKPRVQENSNKTKKDFLDVGQYDRCVHIFDHDLESSDEEMEENSNYDMHESSDAEIEENSDIEIQEIDEIIESPAPRKFSKEVISKALKELSRVERELQEKAKEQLLLASKGIGPLPQLLYPVPKGYNAFIHATEGFTFPLTDEEINECNRRLRAHSAEYMMTLFNKNRVTEEKPSSPTPCLVTNSAEIVLNLVNQMSTVLPKKTATTAFIKEQIKELKPMQQAIQFENRKYMTRSQFNRQNRNYIYQASVKTNRRKNLQRNHSGANNNRKC